MHEPLNEETPLTPLWMEMYRLMGYSETQLMQIQQFTLLQHGGLFWSSASYRCLVTCFT